MGGPEFENAWIGDVGDLAQHQFGDAVVLLEQRAHPGQRPDHTAFDLFVHVVAVEVFRTIGLQQPVQAGGIGVPRGMLAMFATCRAT